MKFLADENIEQPIVTALRKQGHNVLYAIDLPPGTADDDILTLAHRESRILITNDKDFGEFIFLQKKAVRGIILLRTITEDSSGKAELVTRLLRKYPDKISNHFVVMSESKIRFRQLKQV